MKIYKPLHKIYPADRWIQFCYDRWNHSLWQLEISFIEVYSCSLLLILIFKPTGSSWGVVSSKMQTLCHPVYILSFFTPLNIYDSHLQVKKKDKNHIHKVLTGDQPPKGIIKINMLVFPRVQNRDLLSHYLSGLWIHQEYQPCELSLVSALH